LLKSKQIKRFPTKRDNDLIVAIYNMRCPTFDQLYYALFRKIKSGRQIAKRRLKKLTAYNYIKFYEDKDRYSIDEKGLEIVRNHFGVIHYNYNALPKCMFYEHNTQCNDFIIALTLACKEAGIIPIKFIPDFFGAKYTEQDNGHKKHRPDVILILGLELFFVEIDCSTEPIERSMKTLSNIIETIKFYLDYMQSGLFRKRYNFDIFRVLFVTDSEIRLNHIREKAINLEYPDQYKRFILLTVKENIHKDLILTNIWQSLLLIDKVLYGIN